MTKEYAGGLYEKLHEPFLKISKAWRKRFRSIPHTWEDHYQEMWAHLMTLPEGMSVQFYIDACKRVAHIALRPYQDYKGEEGRPYVYEIPTDPEFIRVANRPSWEDRYNFESDIKRLLDDDEYRLLWYKMKNKPKSYAKGERHKKEYTGWSNNEIAKKVGVSPRTFYRMVDRIIKKLEVYLNEEYPELVGLIDERLGENRN